MVITPKGNDKADISMSPSEMAKMLSVTKEIIDLLNKRFDGCALTQLLIFVSFFTGNMARWFSQSVVNNDGNILTEEEFADLICGQAKSLMKQLPQSNE